MEKITEKIICAAIWFNDGVKRDNQPKNIESGFVVSGRRHHNCYSTLQAIGRSLGIDTGIVKNLIDRITRDHQGFLTSSDRYVSREEGFKIAKANNQIWHKLHDNDDEGMLISEDLY